MLCRDDWQAERHWPRGRVDGDAARVIADLVKVAGTAAPVYAEGLAEAFDDHRLGKHGHRVPIEQWDASMREPCGATWLNRDEAAILLCAKSVGYG
jgi:hypothetical protein